MFFKINATMKKLLNPSVCVLYILFVFCNTILPSTRAVELTIYNDSVSSYKTFPISWKLPYSICINGSDNSCENEEQLQPVRNIEELIKLLCSSTVANLSPKELKSAIKPLISTQYITYPLPPSTTFELVVVFVNSPKLFSTIPQRALDYILTITTVNQCFLNSDMPTQVHAEFLKGLFSLPPGVLNNLPKSVFNSILGTITSPVTLNALSSDAIKNLITALSLSKSSFNCIPIPSLLSLLTFMATSPVEIVSALPPSTVFGFLEGLLDTLYSSNFLMATIPNSALVPVLSPIMTSRMLSVLPIRNFNLLLGMLGSYPELSQALPISNFISIITILTTSPKILNSLNPVNFAKFLSTITLHSSIFYSIPSTSLKALLCSVDIYLPSSLQYIPSHLSSVLFSIKN